MAGLSVLEKVFIPWRCNLDTGQLHTWKILDHRFHIINHFGFPIYLYSLPSTMSFFKDSLGTHPWHLPSLERAEDFGFVLLIYLGVDRGSMLSSIAVSYSYLCSIHELLVALVLSLARCARLLSAEYVSGICSLFVGSVHRSGKLSLMF